MVTIDRKLAGLLPYKTVFFPAASALAQTLDGLAPIQMVRFFWTAAELGPTPLLVSHERTATICIDLTRRPDSILEDMSQTTRRKLRQAEKLGGRVNIVRNGADARRDFIALYDGFVRSKRTGVAPISASVVRRYAGHSDVFVLYHDGVPLCGHMNLRDTESGRDRLLYSANRRFDDPETARLCAMLNCYLHWHEICAYRDDGFSTYDLGGLSSGENAGLDRFKSSFGGNVVAEHTYLCASAPSLVRILLRFRARFAPSTRFQIASAIERAM